MGAIAAAGIGAAGVIGAAALSASGSKQGAQQSQSQTSSTAPWSVQQPYLATGFQGAQSVYDQQYAAGANPYQLYAPTTGSQQQDAVDAHSYTGGYGGQVPYSDITASNNGLAYQPFYEQNAANMAWGGTAMPNQTQADVIQNYAKGGQMAGAPAVNGDLSSALNTAGTNGAYALNNFNSGLSRAADTAASDPTSRITADATNYMNTSPIQGSINSTNALIDQTLNEQTLPGLNRMAASGGDLNSSRAGAANAQAQEGAALAKGSADASITNNAWNSGLATANNAYATGLGASVNANVAGLNGNSNMAQGVQNAQIGQNEFGTTSRLGAASNSQASDLNYITEDANAKIAANAQLGTGVNQGLTAGLDAGTAAAGNYGLSSTADALAQTNEQNSANAKAAEWAAQNGGASNTALMNYMKNIQGNYGSSGTSSSTTQNPYSPVSSALGTAATLGGLYKNNQSSFDALGNYIGGNASIPSNNYTNPTDSSGYYSSPNPDANF